MKQSEKYRSRHSMEVPGKSTEVPGGCTEVPDSTKDFHHGAERSLFTAAMKMPLGSNDSQGDTSSPPHLLTNTFT